MSMKSGRGTQRHCHKDANGWGKVAASEQMGWYAFCLSLGVSVRGLYKSNGQDVYLSEKVQQTVTVSS